MNLLPGIERKATAWFMHGPVSYFVGMVVMKISLLMLKTIQRFLRKRRYSMTCWVVKAILTVCNSAQYIAEVQQRLVEHKQQFRRTLASPKADYTTVSGVQV